MGCVFIFHSNGRMSARGGKKKTTKLSRSARAGVIFPVGRMMRYLRTGTHKYRIGMGAPVYMAAVIEYLAGKASKHNSSQQTIKCFVIPVTLLHV